MKKVLNIFGAFVLGETERTELKYLEKQHVKQFEVYLIQNIIDTIQYQIQLITYYTSGYNFIFIVLIIDLSVLWYRCHFKIFLRYFFSV